MKRTMPPWFYWMRKSGFPTPRYHVIMQWIPLLLYNLKINLSNQIDVKKIQL